MSSAIELEKVELENNNPSQFHILSNYIFKVLPSVNKRLRYWKKVASKITDDNLRHQALASLDMKAFHCQGGSVYAVNNYERENLLDLIVAYQTICDYLDNLCDRAGVTEEKSFITLHDSLIDALTPNAKIKKYYADYMFKEDTIYLNKLVSVCQKAIKKLPSYNLIYADVLALTNLYINLQVKKHIDWSKREQVLTEWAIHEGQDYPFIKWPEFAAATGSTLAVFALFRLATKRELTSIEVKATVNAYFPWICGLHILLDYFIDQEEDRVGGDLNFTFYYLDNEEMIARLKLFSKTSLNYSGGLPDKSFHQTVVQGLLAMYLSDAKVKKEGKYQISQELLKDMGKDTVNIYRLCSIVRKFI